MITVRSSEAKRRPHHDDDGQRQKSQLIGWEATWWWHLNPPPPPPSALLSAVGATVANFVCRTSPLPVFESCHLRMKVSTPFSTHLPVWQLLALFGPLCCLAPLVELDVELLQITLLSPLLLPLSPGVTIALGQLLEHHSLQEASLPNACNKTTRYLTISSVCAP